MNHPDPVAYWIVLVGMGLCLWWNLLMATRWAYEPMTWAQELRWFVRMVV